MTTYTYSYTHTCKRDYIHILFIHTYMYRETYDLSMSGMHKHDYIHIFIHTYMQP